MLVQLFTNWLGKEKEGTPTWKLTWRRWLTPQSRTQEHSFLASKLSTSTPLLLCQALLSCISRSKSCRKPCLRKQQKLIFSFSEYLSNPTFPWFFQMRVWGCTRTSTSPPLHPALPPFHHPASLLHSPANSLSCSQLHTCWLNKQEIGPMKFELMIKFNDLRYQKRCLRLVSCIPELLWFFGHIFIFPCLWMVIILGRLTWHRCWVLEAGLIRKWKWQQGRQQIWAKNQGTLTFWHRA